MKETVQEKITKRIAFYEENWSELSDKFQDAKEKHVRNYIRTQIHQCHIAIETLKALLADVEACG